MATFEGKRECESDSQVIQNLRAFVQHPILVTALLFLGKEKTSRRISFSDEMGLPLSRTTTFERFADVEEK